MQKQKVVGREWNIVGLTNPKESHVWNWQMNNSTPKAARKLLVAHYLSKAWSETLSYKQRRF